MFEKLCDKIGMWFRFSRNDSDNTKTIVKSRDQVNNVTSSTVNGNANTINNVDTVNLFQGAGSNLEGSRRKAIRDIGKKANDLNWAIEQSKNPKVGNKPDSYLSKLKDAYETQFEFLSENDVNLLDPLISAVIDYRKGFPQLQEPLNKLLEALTSLK